MSGSVQPVEIVLQPSEVPTVIAALRFWQAVALGNMDSFDRLMAIEGVNPTPHAPTGNWTGLNIGQIDVLCTMIERSAKR
ncbi:hypothetical protein LCGC14_1611570 [marine sediment metagenome]|uniref:Uncharacterized protein n=1 Tax=marine sediment metagenome TaxID=412755 RepID=A0A0F9IUU2_9ZZZZ